MYFSLQVSDCNIFLTEPYLVTPPGPNQETTQACYLCCETAWTAFSHPILSVLTLSTAFAGISVVAATMHETPLFCHCNKQDLF